MIIQGPKHKKLNKLNSITTLETLSPLPHLEKRNSSEYFQLNTSGSISNINQLENMNDVKTEDEIQIG